MQMFPMFMFHKVHGRKLLKTMDEFNALSPEWRDNPSKVDEPIPAPPDPEPTGETDPEATGVDPKAAELYAMNVPAILAVLKDATDTIALNAAFLFESHNPKKPRKMVLDAIKARLEELAAPKATEEEETEEEDETVGFER